MSKGRATRTWAASRVLSSEARHSCVSPPLAPPPPSALVLAANGVTERERPIFPSPPAPPPSASHPRPPFPSRPWLPSLLPSPDASRCTVASTRRLVMRLLIGRADSEGVGAAGPPAASRRPAPLAPIPSRARLPLSPVPAPPPASPTGPVRAAEATRVPRDSPLLAREALAPAPAPLPPCRGVCTLSQLAPRLLPAPRHCWRARSSCTLLFFDSSGSPLRGRAPLA